MKKKVFNKKLSLNKTTVSKLSDKEMVKLNGGVPVTNTCQVPNEPMDLSNANGGRCWFGTVFCPI